MKRIFTVLITVLLILPTASGCIKRDVDFSEPEGLQTPNSIWLAYDYLNDVKEYKITLDAPTTINADITTDSGALWIKLVNEDGISVYDETVSKKKTFTIDIADGGKYRIIVKGLKHTGGFLFDWQNSTEKAAQTN